MARSEGAGEAITQLETAIAAMAKQAAAEDVAGYAEKYASAARQLAEARAWLTSPSQPHGGQTTTSS